MNNYRFKPGDRVCLVRNISEADEDIDLFHRFKGSCGTVIDMDRIPYVHIDGEHKPFVFLQEELELEVIAKSPLFMSLSEE